MYRALARPATSLTRHVLYPTHRPLLYSLSRFSSSAGLDRESTEKRVLEVLKSFEKVDPAKVLLSPRVHSYHPHGLFTS
jgi:hypothetical protein